MINHPYAPYSLGYIDNPVLPVYRTHYDDHLLSLWKIHVAHKEDSSQLLSFPREHILSFLRISDIAGNLCIYDKTDAPPKMVQDSADWIDKQWNIFIDSGRTGLHEREGQIIPGTSIYLSDWDAIPSIFSGNTHPQHTVDSVGSKFGDISPEEWGNLYGKSFSMLQEIFPGFTHELNSMIQKIVPFGVSYQQHNSASYAQVIGNIYSSYPVGYDAPDIAVLEAIIHESNHNKLNLIRFKDPLFLNDFQAIYYSPYRPDARPISGLYLGLHAMVAVYYVLFLCVQRGIIAPESVFAQKSVGYMLKNHLTIETLRKYAHLTPLGQTIFDDMIRVHTATIELVKTLGISPDVFRYARAVSREHFDQAQRSNRVLYY